MRQFVILGHKASVDPGFTLNDLPGAGGRMDVLCRAIGASFFVSHGIRRDVDTHLLLQGRVHIRISGDRVRHLNPDERSTAALIKHALKALSVGKARSTPGITVAERSLAELLRALEDAGARPVMLHEEGQPIEDVEMPSHPAFFLSDHTEFSEQDDATLGGLPKVSLGPTALHTSQAITIVHYLLDRRDQVRPEDQAVALHAWGEPQALTIKAVLEERGIPVIVRTRDLSPGLPASGDGLARLCLHVRTQDLDRAKRVIRDHEEASGRCPRSPDPRDLP